MSGMEEYLLAILESDENGNLPCILADGIFNTSAMVMTTNLHEGTTLDKRRIYKRLVSIRQPIKLQYGSFLTCFVSFGIKRHLGYLRRKS